jgi:hypothetical protein
LTKLVKPGEEYPNYTSVSYIRTPGGPMYSFKNLTSEGLVAPLHLPGKWFLMPKGYHYHHFIKEVLGPFLYYKHRVDSSIQILWVEQPIDSPTGQLLERVTEEIKNMLNTEVLKEAVLNDATLHVDELVVFSCNARFLHQPGFIKHYEFCNIGYFDFPEVNQELRSFFSPYMIEDATKPKKIFITRKDADTAIEVNNRENDFKERYQNKDVTHALEDFFINQGYTVLSLSGMSVFEQISYFYNAEVVAGAPGTNLCNLIYSKPNVSITQIRQSQNYSYPWEKEFDSVLSPVYQYIDLFNVHTYEEAMRTLTEAKETINL